MPPLAASAGAAASIPAATRIPATIGLTVIVCGVLKLRTRTG
jgi:hypothetical protein